jgi:hypothetical protein
MGGMFSVFRGLVGNKALSKVRQLPVVLGIRIRRIRMFLGHPDPGSITISQELRIRILPFSHKCVEQSEIMLAK